MKLQRILVWLNALFFLAYGALFILAPGWAAALVTDTRPGSASGLIDMRATYGGMSLAVGLLFALLARNPSEEGMPS